MPQKSPKCIQCDKTDNVQHHLADGTNLCGECYEKLKYDIKIEQPEVEPATTSTVPTTAIIDEKKTRKSTRSTRFKASSRANSTAVTASKSVLKGKGRRIKKPPTKTPTSTATIRTVDSLFYDKSYYQVGDIVSLIDRSEDIYYAQIRGLLVDSYCEKAAFLTWLLPTKSSPPVDRFDPSTYLIGPEEDFPRKLSCMQFVMHAPSNYYYDKSTPYPAPDILSSESHEQKPNFIWSQLNVTSLSQIK